VDKNNDICLLSIVSTYFFDCFVIFASTIFAVTHFLKCMIVIVVLVFVRLSHCDLRLLISSGMCNKTQVYSQLTFTCPVNKSIVEFRQELKDDRETLLDDIARTDCRSVQSCIYVILFNRQKCYWVLNHHGSDWVTWIFFQLYRNVQPVSSIICWRKMILYSFSNVSSSIFVYLLIILKHQQ